MIWASMNNLNLGKSDSIDPLALNIQFIHLSPTFYTQSMYDTHIYAHNLFCFIGQLKLSCVVS